MNNCIIIGPAVIELQDFLKYPSLFKTWHWKLDSFLSLNENADISINMLNTLFKESSKNEYVLIEKEKSGLFDRIVYTTKTAYFFHFLRRSNQECVLSFEVNSGWDTVQIVEDHTNTLGQYAFEYLSFIIPFCMIKKDVLTIHGVLMEYDGQGIIISANSGVGKTTHARLWKKYKNAFVINGDKAACYKKDGIWTGFGMPWCGTSGEYMNREVPIRAIVFLERGEENSAERIGKMDGFKKTMGQALYPAWDEELAEKVMDLIGDFVESIPVYRLRCKPDKEAVEVLAKSLLGE